MFNQRTFAELQPKLVALGFAFYGEPSQEAPDPEQTLVQVIELSGVERKTFLMLLAWLEKARDLVHVERLKPLVRELSIPALPVFGAVCLKQVHAGDKRFGVLVRLVRERTNGLSVFPGSPFASDPYLISQRGIDAEFAEFGIQTATLSPSDEKKILSRETILMRNAWIRMRALMGSNFRADVAYLMAYGRAKNAHQAFKLLGCNLETAYRLWNSLSEIPGIEKLAS